MKILVSACLLGRNCKYNGGNNYHVDLVRFLADKEVIPVCPEELAGLGTPRIPIEICNGVVVNRDGILVDAQIRTAVETILAQIRDEPIAYAVLKSRSPTCGVRQIYDGTFQSVLIDGMGVLAKALSDAGYRVIDVEDIPFSPETNLDIVAK